MEFTIKGSSFHQSSIKYCMNKEFELGGLYLERDRHNDFDPYAIKVMCANWQLGWIPASQNKDLSIDLDNGINYDVEVVNWNTAYDSDTFVGLTIKVNSEFPARNLLNSHKGGVE